LNLSLEFNELFESFGKTQMSWMILALAIGMAGAADVSGAAATATGKDAAALAAPTATVADLDSPRQARGRPEIYVTNEASGDLTVIDGTDLKAVATIPLGKRPRGVQLSPDHTRLYVALSGWPVSPPGVDERTLPPPDRSADGVGIVDIRAGKLLGMMRGVTNPEQLAVGPDGMVYAPSEDSGSVVVLDPKTRSPRATIAVGDQPEGVAISPDGKALYVSLEGDDTVAVIDLKSRQVTSKIAVGQRPRSIAVSADGSRLYVTNEVGDALSVIDASANKLIQTVKFADERERPMGIALSSNRERAYVTTGRGGDLIVVDTASGAVLQTVKVGARPWGVCRSGDGKTLFTANGPSNDVTSVDTASGKVTARIAVGQKPWGIACAPGS
jgi:YVTN family beta-propeller protein